MESLTFSCLFVLNLKKFLYAEGVTIFILMLRNRPLFLDASTLLYKRLCPSVGWSVGPSVRHAFLKNRKFM